MFHLFILFDIYVKKKAEERWKINKDESFTTIVEVVLTINYDFVWFPALIVRKYHVSQI